MSAAVAQSPPPALARPREPARRPRRRRPPVVLGVAAAWGAVVLVCCLVPQLLAPGDPLALHTDRVLQAPGEGALLGTDQFGRSVLGLLVHGARQSVLIGVTSMLLSVLLGGGLGLLAGYVGGKVDLLVGRLIDVLMCFPGILLALIIAAALGPSTRNVVIAVGIGHAPAFARVMRGQVMSIRSRPYIEAARATGLSHRQIVGRHILPNSMAPLVVLATIEVGSAIVSAASLSFLGAGSSAGVPDWGRTISDGQPYLSGAWWITTSSGLALTLTVISLSLFGDWLRDRLDITS